MSTLLIYTVGSKQHGLGHVKRCLTGYLQVPRIMDEDDVEARVLRWLGGRSVDRVLSNWEPLVILAARIRDRLQMPGMSADVVRGFRDKELMKSRARAAQRCGFMQAEAARPAPAVHFAGKHNARIGYSNH